MTMRFLTSTGPMRAGVRRMFMFVGEAPFFVSDLATVVGPVQQSLALSRPTCWVTGLAVRLDLRDVPPDGLPSFYLARIFPLDAPSHVIATVPLKPAARIIGIDPPFPAPDRERLARINPEIVQRAVAA